MVWGKRGYVPCKVSCLKSHHGSQLLWYQLAHGLGWEAPAYVKKEETTHHPSYCKHSLQYDGWPDGRFVVRVGMTSVGNLRGKGEVCEEVRKRVIDVCCMQVVSF